LFFCIIIAIGLWTFFTLNQYFTTSQRFNLSYINIPKDKIPVEPLTPFIEAEIRGQGWDLLTLELNRKPKEIIADLSLSEGIYLNEKELMTMLQNQLTGTIKPLQIIPRRIPLIFEPKFSKKIPLTILSDISFRKNFYQLGNIIIDPDSVEISGPQTIVESLNFWETDTIKLEALEKSKKGQATLSQSDKFNISFSDFVVDYEIKVEQYTEKKLVIPVNIINSPSDFEILTLPKTVNLKCLVPIEMYENIDAKDFKITADFLNQKNKDLIYLTLTRQPAYIKEINFTPNAVEFIKYEKE